MKSVEQEFKEIKARPINQADSFEIMKAILHQMVRANKHWHFAKEFMGIHYKAPQRLSDLATFYPDLVEVRALSNRHNAYKVYRLKVKKSEFPKWAK